MIRNYHDNSRAAFESMLPHAGTLDAQIIDTLDEAGRDGLIAQEIVYETGRQYSAVTGNLAHLKKRGLIVETGEKRLTLSKRNAAVLVCTWHAPQPEQPKTQQELFGAST